MKKKILSVILLFLTLTTHISCTSNKINSNSDLTQENTEESNSNDIFFTANYSGEISKEDINTNIPFMAIIENSPDSRPQSGLSDADIIYETSAEGNIPRFIALFHSKSPTKIGPIRSARPYFIHIAKENNLPFAHCGGSEEALNTINDNYSIMSINEISNGDYFWRDDTRKAPHNLYTSSDKIREYIKNSNWTISPTKFYKFDSSVYENSTLNVANNLKISINKDYSTSYVYKNSHYYKYMDDKIAIDSNNDKPLSFSNIIIQKTDITTHPDNVHLNINLVGKGDGFILSQGKYLPITWKCSSEDSKTYLYDKDGNEISLTPGRTIWHIIDSKTQTTIE